MRKIVRCIGCNADVFAEELDQMEVNYRTEEGYFDDVDFLCYNLTEEQISHIEGLREDGIDIELM